MALIICPECGNSISDKSKCCIHCGYPLDVADDADAKVNADCQQKYFDMVVEKENEEHMALTPMHILKNEYKSETWHKRSVPGTVLLEGIEQSNINYLKQEFLKMGYIMQFVPSNSDSPNPINSIIEDKRKRAEKELEKSRKPLTCPRCGSTAITTGQRGFSLLSGFLGSNKTVNRCGNCGLTWEPK